MKKTFLTFSVLVLTQIVFAGEWPSYLHVYKGSVPVVDGIIADGEYDDATVIDGVDNWNDQFMAVQDSNDLSLKCWVKHDGNNLYFAFDINDDVLYGIDTPRWVPDENPEKVHDFTKASFPWFGDGVELLVNASYTWSNEVGTFNHGDARSWQVVCNHTKSLLGGIGKGGLIQGEQRDNPKAWENHEKWIRSGDMKAVTTVKPDKSGYIVEWMISPKCLQVDKDKEIFWSPDIGIAKMGLNIGIQDLDNRETAPDNWGRFHHEAWWAGEKDYRTEPRQWGTMYIHPEPKIKEIFVSPKGKKNNPGTKESPLSSIEDAKNKIQRMKKNGLTGEVVIWIRDGRYEIESPIVFNCFDSGNDNLSITYRAWPGEKPVISGGKILQGTWEKHKGDIWALDMPAVRDQQWWFRQLFKNGTRQTRSRYPNDGQWLTVKKTDPAGEFNDPVRVHLEEKLPFGSLARKESEAVMFNLWSISRAIIAASNDSLIHTRTPLGWIGHGATSIQPGRKLYLEHGYDFIDQPSEWYLDRDEFVLYYMAQEGENPNDSEWIAPFAKQLVRLQGRSDEPIRNLKFKGITFEHAAWQLPIAGYSGIQAGYYGSKYVSQATYSPLMAILCEYTDQCTFEDITLAHTGTSGIGLGAGCNNTLINGSTLDDIGGTGILVGWRRIANEPPRRWFENDWADSLDVPKNNKVTNNELSNCGEIHLSSTAIMTAFTEDTLIAHNEIYDMPHIGITVGFIWNDDPTSQKRTIVEYNHIHHCMKRLIDGAAVYTLGYQPGTVVRNNYIHDILNGHGLYTDEGSAHILFENNIIYRTGLRGFNQNYGHHNIVRNNMFIYPCLNADAEMWGDFEDANFMLYPRYLQTSVVTRNRGDFDVDGSFIIERNIMLFNKGQYFNTNNAQGTNTFKIDNNVIWNTYGNIGSDTSTYFEGNNLSKWQQRGHDRNSILADPMFVNLKVDNFRLQKDSPAFKLGFKPIDISKVGPKK